MKTILALLFLFPFTLYSQIVNIEKQRMSEDQTGWNGEVSFNLSAQKTTKKYTSFSTSGLLQHNTEKSRFLVLTHLNLLKAEGEDLSNERFGHFRYNTKFSKNKNLELESFTQFQYNSLTQIKLRWLTGTGIRIQLTPYEKAKFYFGALYMLEYENLISPASKAHDNRLSTYLSFSLFPEETVSFLSTTYAQPRFSNLDDYRILSENSLLLSVSNRIDISINVTFAFDSFPPPGVPEINYFISNGISLSFN